MGIMVYSLYWVMQDFVHQQYGTLATVGKQGLRLRIYSVGGLWFQGVCGATDPKL